MLLLVVVIVVEVVVVVVHDVVVGVLGLVVVSKARDTPEHKRERWIVRAGTDMALVYWRYTHIEPLNM